MTPDAAAQLTILVLAAAGCAVIVWQVRECGSISVWVLTRFFRTYCMLMLSQRIHGRCPLPVAGGALLVANHRSPADPMLVYSASILKTGGYRTRVLEFLTAAEYCGYSGVLGWVMQTCRVIPVQRDGKDSASAREALRRLQRGQIIGVFPEGGIHLGPGLGEFDSGVGWLALRGGQPVIPAVVRNSPYREPIFASFLVRQRADVLFGPPVDLSRWQGQRPTQEVLREVTEHLRGVLQGMLTAPASSSPERAG